MQQIGYIYTISNLITHKIYVGQTENARQRKADHFNELRRGKHCNKRLQTDVDIYGIENFTFEVLQECGLEELNTLEDYYIKYFDSRNPAIGYNIAPVRSDWMYKAVKLPTLKESNNYARDFVAWVVRLAVIMFIGIVVPVSWISFICMCLAVVCGMMCTYYSVMLFRSSYGI